MDRYEQSYVIPTIYSTRMHAEMGRVTWASEPGMVAHHRTVILEFWRLR